MKNWFGKDICVLFTYLCVYSFIIYILSTPWKGFEESYNIKTHIKEAKKKKERKTHPTQNKDNLKAAEKIGVTSTWAEVAPVSELFL